MPALDALLALHDEARAELQDHILPFWLDGAVDPQQGGFVGQIRADGVVEPAAPKGAVLNARILWTFAAAARHFPNPRYRAAADRAFHYLRAHFWDPNHGGVFWALTPAGVPLEAEKRVYAQAFLLYALAEYHRLTERADVLDWAKAVYTLLELHAADHTFGGYFEVYSRDWHRLPTAKLSDKDLAAPKSMNTNLHVLEAYTNLYRIWPDAGLRGQLGRLLRLFLDRLIDPHSHHLHSYFSADWASLATVVSFGHDIETSWLLVEAAEGLEDAALLQRVQACSLQMAEAVRLQGLDRDGGLFSECDAHGLDTDKYWWPQAEAVVGMLNAYQLSGDAAYLQAVLQTWAFIQTHVVDRTRGEWHARLTRHGTPYPGEDKVGFWKCPYHNARACLELMDRVNRLRPHPRRAPSSTPLVAP